jgi:hypothetical protein
LLGVVTAGMFSATLAAVILSLRCDDSQCTEDCGLTRVDLPEAAGYGAADPVVEIALFVDLESSASRQAYQHTTRSIHALGLETPAVLRLLHRPGSACAAGATNVGCVGARAVECAERLAGVGVRAAGAVFDLQWAGSTGRTPSAVVAAVAGLGVDEAALARCVEEDAAVDERLAAHAATAASYGLAAAPGGWVVMADDPTRSAGFGAWLTERTLTDVVRCLAQRRCEVSS